MGDKPFSPLPNLVLSREDMKAVAAHPSVLLQVPTYMVRPLTRLMRFSHDRSPRGDLTRLFLRLMGVIQQKDPQQTELCLRELEAFTQQLVAHPELLLLSDEPPPADVTELTPPLVFRVDEAEA